MTDFFSLPWEDIICKLILSYLNLKEIYRLQRVNKALQNISTIYIEQFCTSIDFAFVTNSNLVNGDVFHRIVKGKSNILRLELKTCKSWLKDCHLQPVLERNGHIQHLNLSQCQNLSENFFTTSVANNLNFLQDLDVSFCRQFPSGALFLIGLNCRMLKSLDVSGCWDVNDEALSSVAVNNQMLSVLRTQSCYAITNVSVVSVAKHCRGLTVLDIRGCWRVKDGAIKMVAEYCKNLKQLYVKDCTNITELSIARMRLRDVILDREKRRTNFQYVSPFLQI